MLKMTKTTHFSIRHRCHCHCPIATRIVLCRHYFVPDIMPWPSDMCTWQAIMLLARTGMRQGAIANSVGVSRWTVNRILQRPGPSGWGMWPQINVLAILGSQPEEPTDLCCYVCDGTAVLPLEPCRCGFVENLEWTFLLGLSIIDCYFVVSVIAE